MEPSRELQLNKSQTNDLYFFNGIVIVLILFLQIQSLLGTLLSPRVPFLSRIVFLLDKVFFCSLILAFFYIKFFGWFVTHDRQGKKNRHGLFVPIKSEIIFLIVLLLFLSWCFLSGIINGIKFPIMMNGTFSYSVYFFVFFIFSSLSYPDKLIRRTYNILLKIAVFLSIVSLGQEILALIYPASASWWLNLQDEKFTWRMGLFRVPSLLGHPNSIGMFALFFWTIELARFRPRQNRGSFKVILLFGLTILLSMSRMAIGSAGIALLLLSPKIRKAGIVLLFLLAPLGLLSISSRDQRPVSSELNQIASYDRYRSFTKDVSLRIFYDHLLFGVGPGMYGGHVSLKHNSPIYERYGFTDDYFKYLHDQVGTIEQQWLQVLAELGAVGFIFFLLLLFSPIVILNRLRQKEKDGDFDFLMLGLMVMPFQMCFYMLGFTITQQSEWLVPYFAFMGMLVSRQRRHQRLNDIKGLEHENTACE